MSEAFPGLAGFGPGSVLAGYRLEAQVGAGGMAVVFRARDQRLDRLVALKILAPAMAADHGLRHRFVAESRAAAAVDDPHIIPVYEAGEAGGVLFIAMRFIQGGDLWQVLQREHPLPPGRAAAFISPVASALDAAHRAGLVHRDVKPGNILVDARPDRPDHVYLSDFGISKRAVSTTGPTAAGQWVGTVDYAAPEQIRGLDLDGRADQYALACVAYQLLTGTVPFKRDQDIAVVYAHLSEPPPSLVSRRPGLPAAADEVLAKAMAKAPEQRYRSCREFADALRQALGLPPYISSGSAAVNEVAARPGAAGPGTVSPGTAGPSAAAIADQLPGNGSVSAPTIPPALVPSGAEQVRLTADSTWSPGAENTVAADPAPATQGRSGRSGRSPGSGGRRRRLIVTAALLVLLAVVVGGGFIFVQSTQGQYYLADSNGQVVIYRGVASKVLGINLSHLYQQTGIPLDQVPTNYQHAVETGYSTGSLAQVQQAAADVRNAVSRCREAYAALQAWVTEDDSYLAAVAQAQREHKPTTGIAEPGPQPAGPGPTCQPPQTFGIASSSLAPAS